MRKGKAELLPLLVKLPFGVYLLLAAAALMIGAGAYLPGL